MWKMSLPIFDMALAVELRHVTITADCFELSFGVAHVAHAAFTFRARSRNDAGRFMRETTSAIIIA